MIAGSYADIFFNNCFKNGVLPISLPGADIDALFAQDAESAHVRWISTWSDKRRRLNRDRFTVSKSMASKSSAFEGPDDIALTLQHEGDIATYEQRRMNEVPWLFEDLAS